MRIYGLLLKMAYRLKDVVPEAIFLNDMIDENMETVDVHIPDTSRIRADYNFISHMLTIQDIDFPNDTPDHQVIIRNEHFVRLEII